MTAPPRVVAIDGPSASGKSTTAAAVARELGAIHVDSGALYRALTSVALEMGGREPAGVLDAAEARGLALRLVGDEVIPYLDGRPAEDRIRGSAVTALVSEVSAWPAIRAWVTARLREAAGPRTLVMDGRDIGTDVFPDAPVKVFLVATPTARARRRLLQRGDRPASRDIDAEAAVLAERDRRDSARAVAPLRRADDAVELDTTTLTFEEQVGEIVRLARSRLP
ncbi:MAG: (d)CMP kinase [Gemmatimonadales bacterium]